MMLARVLLALFFFTAHAVHAQKTGQELVSDSIAKPLPDAGNVTLEFGSADLEKYIHLMDSLDGKNLKSMGFRIQIYSASGPNSHQTAYQRQSDFLNLYRNYPSYTKWSSPNWVVRVGDFRTRLEAVQFHNELRNKYPASFIIRDEINLQPTATGSPR